MKKKNIVLLAIAIIIVGAVYVYASTQNNKKNVDQQLTSVNNEQTPAPNSINSEKLIEANKNSASNNKTGLANPASINCQDKGGKVVIEKKDDGSEYGLCYFDDNRACEEWAMLRGDCPVGGRKTTGYDTIAQKFCAWSGGQTLAVENAVCTFKDGSTCLADDFYKGTCEPKKLVD